MRLAAAPRWAISFADLALLLLGCFVMLHVMRREGAAAAPATREAVAPRLELAANELFEPGEARLTAAGRTRLQAIAARMEGRRVFLVSRGGGEGGARLDAFELAAARAAAIGRALVGDEARVAIEIAEAGDGPQRITLRAAP